MATSHPEIFEEIEPMIIEAIGGLALCRKITGNGPSLITLDGSRSFAQDELRFRTASTVLAGRVLFVADDHTIAKEIFEPEGALEIIRERNNIDRTLQYPMTTLNDIPPQNRIPLHELIARQGILDKLVQAAIHQGLSYHESADGWAADLVGAGIKCAANPNTVLVAQREELDAVFDSAYASGREQQVGNQKVIAQALRSWLHGIMGATCFMWSNRRFDVPKSILEIA